MARICPRPTRNPVSHFLRRMVIRWCPSRVGKDQPESVHGRTPNAIAHAGAHARQLKYRPGLRVVWKYHASTVKSGSGSRATAYSVYRAMVVSGAMRRLWGSLAVRQGMRLSSITKCGSAALERSNSGRNSRPRRAASRGIWDTVSGAATRALRVKGCYISERGG